MKRWFFGVVVCWVLIWLMGCGEEDTLGPAINYSPYADVEAAPGAIQKVVLSDGFPWDKAVKDPALLAILNNGSAQPAPATVPTIWYQTNGVINTERTGFIEGTGTSSGTSTISLSLVANEFIPQDGYTTFWIIPRRGSSSGDLYPWLKLSDGTMPQYAETNGKIHFEVLKNGIACWVVKGNLILSHTITLENVAIGSGVKIYVKGDKSTSAAWLEMDVVSASKRELKVMAGTGRETLEFKDASGKRYRYKVTVDGAVITYGDPSRDYSPTFEYTASGGVQNLTPANLSWDVGISVVERDGGTVPQPPEPAEFNLVIEASTLRLSPIDKSPFGEATRIYAPNSRNGWRADDLNYAANVASNRWEFDLNKFPRERSNRITRFNLYAGSWLLKEKLPEHQGWAQTSKGEWSLAVVWSGAQWKWYQQVFPVSQLVPENPD